MIIEIRNHQGYVIEDFPYTKRTRGEAVHHFKRLVKYTARDWDTRAEVTDYAKNHVARIELSHEGETICEFAPDFAKQTT